MDTTVTTTNSARTFRIRVNQLECTHPYLGEIPFYACNYFERFWIWRQSYKRNLIQNFQKGCSNFFKNCIPRWHCELCNSKTFNSNNKIDEKTDFILEQLQTVASSITLALPATSAASTTKRPSSSTTPIIWCLTKQPIFRCKHFKKLVYFCNIENAKSNLGTTTTFGIPM
jgi:hypothetical protein